MLIEGTTYVISRFSYLAPSSSSVNAPSLAISSPQQLSVSSARIRPHHLSTADAVSGREESDHHDQLLAKPGQ